MVHGRSVFRLAVPTALGLAVLLAAAVPVPAARSSNPEGISARGYQRGIGGTSGILVSWKRPKTIPSSLILGYVVWRRDDLGGFNLVGGVDNDAIHSFVDVTSNRDVFAFNGDPGQDAGSRTRFQNVPGIVPGLQYRYQVSAAARGGLLDRDNNGVPDGTQIMTPLSIPSGVATAIAPPTVATINGEDANAGNGVTVNPRSFQVEWQQTAGADTYIVWVSSDPRFPAGKRFATKPFRTSPVDLGGPTTVTRTVKLGNAKLRRARRLYVAVGARNSGDRLRPVPFGAIFSSPVKVRPVTAPPDPPSG